MKAQDTGQTAAGGDRTRSAKCKYRKEIDELCLLDDQYMKVFFEEDAKEGCKCIEYILQTLLNKKDLKVVQMHAQDSITELEDRHSVVLDLYARDRWDNGYNVEMQRAGVKKEIVKRTRFNSSTMDVHSFEIGRPFRELKPSYVIFICEQDFYGKGCPFYEVNRTVKQLNNAEYGDESHIILVNSNYDGDDPVGWLMHDIRCKDVKAMRSRVLARIAESIK